MSRAEARREHHVRPPEGPAHALSPKPRPAAGPASSSYFFIAGVAGSLARTWRAAAGLLALALLLGAGAAEAQTSAPTVSSVSIVSKPRTDADSNGTKETYGAGQTITVAVTWSADVTWDVSAANAGITVQLTIGSNTRSAELVTHGATSGQAATLWFSYTVVAADADTDGIAVTPDSSGNLALLRNSATLVDGEGRNAAVTHAGLSAQSGHLVNGAAAAPANTAPKFDGGAGKNISTRAGPTATLISEALAHSRYSDADGDPLTFTASADPEYAINLLNHTAGLLFILPEYSCRLANVIPTPDQTVISIVSYTATDPDGASVAATITLDTSWSCPAFSSAGVNGNTLTVTLDANPAPAGDKHVDAPTAKVLTADEFEVKVDGTAVALAASNPVSWSEDSSQITLTLAAAVADGSQVTVSYSPGKFPAAVAFTDKSAANAPATGAPTISGVLQVGRTLTAATGDIMDSDGLTGVSYSHQWTRVDGSAETDIAGATSSTYTLAMADQGKTVKVKVTFQDDAGNSEELTSTATAAVAAAARTCTAGNLWCATLTVAADPKLGTNGRGYCDSLASQCTPDSYGALSDPDFTLDGTDYTVRSLRWGGAGSSGNRLHLTLDRDFPANELANLTLKVDSHSFAPSDAQRSNSLSSVTNNYRWSSRPDAIRDYPVGLQVTVELLYEDITAPAFSSATVNGATLKIVFDETLDTGSTPVPGDFDVQVAGSSRSVASGGVAIAGSTVTLTLSSAVSVGESVTVAYTRPSSNPLQDATGNAVADLAAQTVTHVTPAAFESAAVNGYTLTVSFDDDLDTNSRPAPGAFHVTVGTAPRDVVNGGVAIDGKVVTLTLASAVLHTDTVKVGYTKPATNPLRDTAGIAVETFGDQAVTNDTPTPLLSGARVSGTTLTLTFTSDLDEDSAPPGCAFRVHSNVVSAFPVFGTGTATVSGRTVTVTLESTVPGTAESVTYQRPSSACGDTPLRYADSTLVEGFSREPLTAPRPPSGGGAPPGGGSEQPGQPGSPVAVAGADVSVDPGAAVMLDGSGSSDPDGDALTYAWSQTSGGSVTLAGAAAARAAFTAPVEPGDLAFRLTVTDPGGLSGSDDVAVSVRDLAPAFGDASVASLTLVLDAAMDPPVVLPTATGGNGELTYGLSSASAGLAGLSFDAATRTLSGTPGTEGSYVFTWRADDADANRADSDAAIQTFRVTVDDARTTAVKRSVNRTLAAVARRALTSALDNIGARFAASVPMDNLTLAGETLAFGGAAGTGDAEAAACTAGGFAHDHVGSVFAPSAFGPSDFGAGPSECALGVSSRSVESSNLLQASAFSLALGAAEGSGTSSIPLWSVWGRGDLGTFAGRPEPGMRYEGELRTGWLGVDARAGAWVAGLALSHGTGEADYSFDGGDAVAERGRLETTLSAFYPYARWTVSDGLELRGVLGAGRGEARHWLADEPQETGDLTMRMGSLGVRQALPAFSGMDLAVRADASLARLETEDGPDYVHGLSADSWRVRAGLEASRRFAFGADTALVPFIEAAARRDGGDGLAGTGLEVVGGVRWTAPRLHVEARGRWLAAHSEEGARERGLSLTVRTGPGAQGRGLSLSLSPRWGAGTGSAEALWRDELPTAPAETSTGAAAALDARVGYGFGVLPYGLLTPFAETGLAGEDGHRLRLGTRFAVAPMHFGVELAGERRAGGTTAPEDVLRLDARLRF